MWNRRAGDGQRSRCWLPRRLRCVGDALLRSVDDLGLISEWSAMHSTDPTQGPNGMHAAMVGDVLTQVGGEGTPEVQEFCLGEIALARGAGYTATRNALADVLGLQHRLPLTWAVVGDGDAEVFIARRVAKLSRHVPLDVVGVVDVAVSRMIAHESGDAAWIDATITRVAEIITPAHDGKKAEEIRAIAFGYLARPAELLQLLLENTEEAKDSDESTPSRATAFPADLLDSLRTLDLSVLRPKAVPYVHLHEAALHGHDTVARVEGLGPLAVNELAHLLGGSEITVKPVIDLAHQIRHTAYEHPESLKERIHLTTGGDYFPYAFSTSRNVDYDHVTPYQPPGQTGTHNSAPLGRRHHRWKTHAGYRTRQIGEDHYVWLDPHHARELINAA